MTDHAYDAPNISAKDFLLAVMRDPTVPLNLRVTAADLVAPFMHPSLPQNRTPVYTVRVPPLSSAQNLGPDTPLEVVEVHGNA
jgi:hypothetical protein